MLKVQRLIPRIHPRVLAPALNAMGTKRFVDWSFGHYLKIAPPEYALGGPHGARFASRGGVGAGAEPSPVAA